MKRKQRALAGKRRIVLSRPDVACYSVRVDQKRTGICVSKSQKQHRQLFRDTAFCRDLDAVGGHLQNISVVQSWARVHRSAMVTVSVQLCFANCRGIRRFRSCLYKWVWLVTCGAEEQIVDHVVLHCPIHRASTFA